MKKFHQAIQKHREYTMKRMQKKVERLAIWLQDMIWSSLHRRMFDCEDQFCITYPMPKRWAPDMATKVASRVAEMMSSDNVSVEQSDSGLKIAVSF